MDPVKVEEDADTPLLYNCSVCQASYPGPLTLSRHIKKNHPTTERDRKLFVGNVSDVVTISLDDDGNVINDQEIKSEADIPSHQPEVVNLESDTDDDNEDEAEKTHAEKSIAEEHGSGIENHADAEKSIAEENGIAEESEEVEEVGMDVEIATVDQDKERQSVDKSTMEIDPSLQSLQQQDRRRIYKPLQVELIQNPPKRLAATPLFTSTPLPKNPKDDDINHNPAIIYSQNELMQWNGYANKYFGIPNLRDYQAGAIKCFTEGRDLLSIVRTGGGKSVCFQLPAVLKPDERVLVIAPISALVREHVMKMQKLGIKAAMLGGNTNSRVSVMSNDISILYCNPECLFDNDGNTTLNMDDLIKRHISGEKKISLIVVDEAHKLFEWATFRPAFDNIKTIAERFQSVPFHLYSATMTKPMQEQAINNILRDPVVIKTSTNRPNIYYRVCTYQAPALNTQPNNSKAENWDKEVEKIINMTKDDEALIYTSFPKTASAVTSSLLNKEKIASEYKGLANQSATDREQVQDEHLLGNIKYLVATSAYGLGIENPRQHTVFRIGLPQSISEWMQEAGRAGRQGQDAMATLLEASHRDIQKIIFWEKQLSSTQQKELKQEMSEVIRYSLLAYAGMCSRKYAMEALDDHTEPVHSHPLGCCNGCNVRKYCSQFIEEYENTSIVNVLLACSEIKNTTVIDKTSNNSRKLHANTNKIIAYLKGKPETVDVDFEVKPDQHSKFGIEKNGTSEKDLKVMVKQCIGKGWLKPAFYYYFHQKAQGGRRQTIVLGVTVTDSGQDVINTKIVDVPQASSVLKALAHVRNLEDKYVNRDETNASCDQAKKKPCGSKNYKQVQPQVEKMLLLPYVDIISKDQYQFLGYNHNCSRLLYSENPANVIGYPGDGNMDFMYEDLNLSKTQGNPPIEKTVSVKSNEGMEKVDLVFTKNSCAGVKTCPGCDFVCSRKTKINTCPRHANKYPSLLINIGDCPGTFVYIKPKDAADTRRWLAFLNGPHDHSCPPISKATKFLEAKVREAVEKDPTLKAGDLQRGYGMGCSPMSISLVAASNHRMQYIKKKVTNPLNSSVSDATIVNFDKWIKNEVDQADEKNMDPETKLEMMQATTPYQRELIQETTFSCGIFMTPLMTRIFSEGEYFECDVTFPGLSTFKYLLNITTFNLSALRHDAVARVLMTRASAKCYEAAFKAAFKIVTAKYPSFSNGTAVKGITMDFCLAQAKGLEEALEDAEDKMKGCRSVHFIRQVDKVIVKVCQTEEEKSLFKKICYRITEEPSKEIVMKLFSVLDGQEMLRNVGDGESTIFTQQEMDIETRHWSKAASWVKWWSSKRVLTMLTEAFSTMTSEDWEIASNHTNHVEALNKVSVADKTKISLKAQLKHMYNEDRRRAYAHIAASKGIIREKMTKSRTASKKVFPQNKSSVHDTSLAQDTSLGHHKSFVGRVVMAKRSGKGSKRNLRNSNDFIEATIQEYCEDKNVFKATFVSYPEEYFEVPSDIGTAVYDHIVLMPADHVISRNDTLGE